MPQPLEGITELGPPFPARAPHRSKYSVIAATVVIVWMYWMRCMKCLLGYMAMSSAVLLGVMGGAVWGSALEVFQLPCDAFTYYGVLWNFAVVGVVAIFYQKVLLHAAVVAFADDGCSSADDLLLLLLFFG